MRCIIEENTVRSTKTNGMRKDKRKETTSLRGTEIKGTRIRGHKVQQPLHVSLDAIGWDI